MRRVIGFTLAGVLSLAGTGCAREDPEARLPDAYEKPLQKAEQVEDNLRDSVDNRLRKLDANN